MSQSNKFVITGGKVLSGTVKSSGAKNSALKVIAAAVLTDKDVILSNVPRINDVLALLKILASMGATYQWLGENKLKLNCKNLKPEEIDQKMVGNLRGSVVLIGPILARYKKLRIHSPGGCKIGARSISTTINALKSFGVNCQVEGKYFNFTLNNLAGAKIVLDEMSVTTTETILMMACLATGQSEINIAAVEPEIANLIDFLKSMGAKISGKNTHNLTIIGKKRLGGGKITIIPDRIEIGTFACAIAATNGEATIENVIPNHLDNLLNKFDRMNIKYQFSKPIKTGDELNSLIIKKNGPFKSVNIDTRPYPGFSTDIQSPMVVLLTQAQGKSKVFETLFEGRLAYIKSLVEMGAKIETVDSRTIIVTGATKLKAAKLDSQDLRSGAAFVIAGLIATGTTEVNKASIIDRGYENFAQKLIQLGAQIERA
jgi:UDP-N-acetylglucosamine 1-carboxyvinyltransferase